jgi:signal transduction histidine kinase/FixJ family two-component response regulator
MKILLVEDNPADARLIAELIRESPLCDCDVLQANRLGTAVDVLGAGEVDLVLLDLSLPDAQELQALGRIVEVAPAVPVIVLTGLQDEQTALRALRAGAQDYLLKGSVESELLVRSMRYARERKRLQEGERFLAEAGSLLAVSLDYEETLQNVGTLAVGHLADFCIIDVVDDDGTLRRLQVSHSDPANAEVAARLLNAPLDRTRPHLVFQVIESRTPLLVAEMSEEWLRSIAQDEEHLATLRAMQARSYMAVPMLAHDRLIGVLLFVSSHRSYDAEDLALAGKLARLAALEVDNARLYRTAQEALRARDRILGIVAHDLRNPLNTMAMGIDLLLEHAMASEMRVQHLHTIRRTADRMNRLIQDLLDVSRLEGDGLQLHKEHLDALRLAREAVELNGMIAAAKEQTLVCETEDLRLHIEADYDRVLRVLQNLIDNAVKFTPRRGSITVRVEPGDGDVFFSVTDTGPGIPPEQIPHIFQPFWQLGRSGPHGAGLGLAIARGLVEAHGGRIWAESKPGIGTTLCFTLPLAAERRAIGDRR